ncbi:MAG: hypothetical protein ISR90_02065 [Candidatus Marinimicrobia bacterium]|nr:hypothetical protein [Candidatus Neomarinimicrobiota bacterium]MBL7022828.1 hypothetical protein [Candidatus Neomarinimicrobiota bacterium]MBL7109451.1 hypothetical protein [Candidatus Neomarinimicrobiota bacterium]
MRKIILLLVMLISIVFAKVPNWGVNPWDFKYTATHTCVLIVDGVESTDESDIIGAFADGECRGLARPTYFPMPGKERHTVNMMLYSNQSYGEFINFKAYDASLDQIFDIQNYEIEFIENENHGDDINVIKLYCITKAKENKSTKIDESTFSVVSVSIRLNSILELKDGLNIPINSIENGEFVLSALKNNISVFVEDENGITPFILKLKQGKIYLKTN